MLPNLLTKIMDVKELTLVDIYLLSYLVFDFDFFQGLFSVVFSLSF